jgi:hypothetical protein
MPSYRKRILSGAIVPSNPPLAPLTGGKVGKADRVASIFAEQDRILAHGRRIVAQVGLNGADAFSVLSIDPDTGSQEYPSATTARVAYRGRFDLTPGHMLRAVAVYAPAGETHKMVPGGSLWESAGAGGAIIIDAEFTNAGGSESISTILEVEASQNEFAAESTTSGAVWAEARRRRSGLIRPDIVDAATAASWSDGVSVELTISMQGGVRPISVIVYEEPYEYVASTETTGWATSIYTNGSGLPLPAYPTPWPVDQVNLGGDPSKGADYLIGTADRQTRSIGPMLLAASAWNEAAQDVTATETDEKTTSSTSFVDLWRTSTTAWSTNIAAWSVSSGGNAPSWNTSGPHLELRDKARVVPVRVRVYAKVSGTGSGTVRVISQVYSLCDLAVTSTSWGWVETTAHLRCGFGAEDETTLTVLGSVSAGTATLHVRYLQIEYVDR